jgi:hypothetical protein
MSQCAPKLKNQPMKTQAQASPSRSPDLDERVRQDTHTLDPEAVDAKGFPTIFRLALDMGTQMGPPVSDGNVSDCSVCETALYDADGFPLVKGISRSILGSEGETPAKADAATEICKDEPEAVTPSSRIRRSIALAKSTLKKPRGRPKKVPKTPPSPKRTKSTKSQRQAKQSKGTKDCKNTKAANDAGPFSSVCCCVCQGVTPRAEITAFVETPQGSKKRVYLFTLTHANWGPSFAEDARKFKAEIESKNMTKTQALKMRDSYREARSQ